MAATAFKSKAQIEKFKTFVSEGKMTQEHFDECMALTKDAENLPERLHPKKDKKENPLGDDPK